MGLYINVTKDGKQLPVLGKADFLLHNVEGCKEIPTPTMFQENLVCVVENGAFDGAGYCYSKAEMESFKRPDMGRYNRIRRWLIVPNAKDMAQ